MSDVIPRPAERPAVLWPRLGPRLWALLLLGLAATLAVASARGQDASGGDEPFRLSADALFGSGAGGSGPTWVDLPVQGWRADLGQRATAGVATLWAPGDAPPAGWTGQGRFSLALDVAPELVDRPLVVRVDQHGAFELRVDGELVAAAGSLSTSAPGFVPRNSRHPAALSFQRAGIHAVEMTYANPRVAWFHRNGHAGGFELSLAPADYGLARSFELDARNRRYQGLFTGIFLTVALLHLMLFAFWPETRENLWFALLCASVAVLQGCVFHYPLARSANFLLWVEPTMNLAGLLMCLAVLRFVYGIFRPDLFVDGWPRRLRWPLLPTAILAVAAVLRPLPFTLGVFVILLLTSLEILRITALAVWHKRPGSLLVGGGIAAMGVGFGLGVLTLLHVLPSSFLLSAVLPFVSVVVLVLTMSVYLSRQVARTSAALRRKLVEVEALSEAKLEHERRARQAAVERERLEAEVRHKQKELEEARTLQLAMLPRSLPEVADLEVAAHMDTATEVGGDYYDFDIADDGSLTVAVGDATGHGMKAGTLVTATKSLFKALGEGGLVDTLDRSSAALKAMNLRQLNMALLLARWHHGLLRVAGAGMPPVLLYRAATGRVEDLLQPGLPLGTPLRGRYQETQLRLTPGDTVLFMSDGFPERIGPSGDPLGYERVQEAFAAAADQPVHGIVQSLLATSEDWAQGRPLDDDLTFVVLKARAA